VIRLAHASIRHPKLALSVWGALAAIFIALGLGVTDRLSPTMTFVPGTESTRAEEVTETEFGPSTLVPILLTGPQKQLDRQGPIVVKELISRADTRVLSAWDAGETGEALRPSKTEAMILASVARTNEEMIDGVQEDVDRTVDIHTFGQVEAHISGTPTLDRAIEDEALQSTRVATLWALPILFLVLLLILRAPLAALVTTAFGGVVAFSGFGVMTLVGQAFDVDAIGVALTSLVGLALGTGLSLMILIRFHKEEAAVTGAPREAALAASAAIGNSGRAVLIAGTGLFVSLSVASVLGPTENLHAVGTGATVNALLATGAAVVVMPAVLALAGTRMFAWSFGAPRLLSAPWKWLVGAGGLVLRRAVLAGAAATLVLVALAIPALNIETGPVDPRFLPPDNEARQDLERIQEAMGPGFPFAFNIVVASDSGPITETGMLRQLERFQIELARDERVASVAGPGEFRAETADLGTLEKKLDESQELLGGAGKDLAELEGGLGQAGAGAVRLQDGLREAASGAGQIAGGGGAAADGATRLKDGLAAARTGSQKISSGLGQALDGANDLKTGSGEALAGAEQIAGGLSQAVALEDQLPLVQTMADNVSAGNAAVTKANESAQALSGQLQSALGALQSMTGGKQDPAYAQVEAALAQAQQSAGAVGGTLGGVTDQMGSAAVIAAGASGELTKLADGLGQLYDGSNDLAAGLTRLRNGNAELAAGIEKLSGGGGDLTAGLAKLEDGAGQLATGLGVLSGGAGELSGGLGGAVPKVGQLGGGLGLMESGVAKFRRNLPSTEDLERLQAQAPGLFDSGYFVLSAIDGAQPPDRNRATFAVNLERGGNAGQITVIPKQPSSSEQTQVLGEDLVAMSRTFAARTGADVAVGGPAGELADFQNSISEDIWPVVIGIAVAITLLLMVALRSVLLPLVVVAFNLLGAAATFGVLTLLTSGDDPVLGELGYIDPLQVIETFASIFGIALVFEMLLLYRTREMFLRTGRPHDALAHGLRETAGAATGAAAVMAAAVIPFAMSDLFNLTLTIGLAIAILIDALIVRPVLLPAATEVLGRAAWWPTSRSAPHPPQEATAPAGAAAGGAAAGRGDAESAAPVDRAGAHI
jgi:putative drug exporter of the RND superfamily